jgi:hypothetical protein
MDGAKRLGKNSERLSARRTSFSCFAQAAMMLEFLAYHSALWRMDFYGIEVRSNTCPASKRNPGQSQTEALTQVGSISSTVRCCENESRISLRLMQATSYALHRFRDTAVYFRFLRAA